MTEHVFEKLHNRRGVSRLIVILIILVFVLLVAVYIPIYLRYKQQADNLACATGLDTARRQLAADFMLNGFGEIDAEHAKEFVGYVMAGWDDLCPAGGTVYIVNDPDNPVDYELVYGLHGSDAKQRTRLNSDYVLEQLRQIVAREEAKGNPAPDSASAVLHHKDLICERTDKVLPIRRGTKTTEGYSDTVVFYGIAGMGDFTASQDAPEGTICWFIFADEDHCAIWSVDNGWTGDSYMGT